MTRSATAHTNNSDSTAAGEEIGERLLAELGDKPDALILFASSRHDYTSLLDAIERTCGPKVLVGGSSAGEFTTHAYEEGSVSAIGIVSDEIQFRAAAGENLRGNREEAARQIVAEFQGMHTHHFATKAALVITDALAGHAEDFVERLTSLTAGTYQLFGGGAGDDANFTRTHVFLGNRAIPDAAVALEILSNKPFGIGVMHSWEPATPAMRVTEADGMRIISINNIPAIELFEEFARKAGQSFSPSDPIPFFLHNTLGIATPAGYKLRVPLAVNPDGSVQCAADIPIGSVVHIMQPRGGSALAATKLALEQLKGAEPEVALFFDCVATRLRMGKDFDFELQAVRETLGQAHYAGCNTYGQIARADGQFSGFHNCTAVVAVLAK